MQRVTPFLWFDNQAEEAARFYVSVFNNSKIVSVTRYGEAGPGPQGSVMTVTFALGGQEFIALNGGPHFKFTEAVSFSVDGGGPHPSDHFQGVNLCIRDSATLRNGTARVGYADGNLRADTPQAALRRSVRRFSP